jgi:hypothetical protein
MATPVACWHEVGHAVAALAIHLPIVAVTVAPAGPHTTRLAAPPWVTGEDLAVHAIAGMVAQHLAGHSEHTGAGTDLAWLGETGADVGAVLPSAAPAARRGYAPQVSPSPAGPP